MKYLHIFPNKQNGFTLLELIVGAGIVGILMMVIVLFIGGGMNFWTKGIPTKPQEIVNLILEGETGKRNIEDWGIIPTIRGGYSIYDLEFDKDQPITLDANNIVIGFGIVDCGNGLCNSTVTTSTDLPLIYYGSPTTTDFTKGTPTITVVSPYDINNPYGTTSQILNTNPAGDDYGLAIRYQFVPIKEIKNGRLYKQGKLYKGIYHKDSAGNWSLIGTQTLIAENISQLEFRYFTDREELPAGTPTALSKIRQINSVMITLAIDNDDDRDGSIEEDKLDGIDNDLDGKIDEDYFNGIRIKTRAYFRNL
ncbi:MAG: prepilin-type N-terminal cleavage/methylation domain-containing protein [bacterium]|nr:prepilin-type N-terminal cleavage/methylation domain-containing protein [bacterium]